jgi:hypothetical protein
MRVSIRRELMSEDIVAHEGSDWRYTYDTSQCPEYDFITMEGELTEELVNDYMGQAVKHSDERFGSSARLCPRIVDVTPLRGTTGMVGALRALRETGNMYRDRYSLVVFVAKEELIGSGMYLLITKFVEATRRDVRFVRTMEEAVELVREYWEQQPGGKPEPRTE